MSVTTSAPTLSPADAAAHRAASHVRSPRTPSSTGRCPVCGGTFETCSCGQRTTTQADEALSRAAVRVRICRDTIDRLYATDVCSMTTADFDRLGQAQAEYAEMSELLEASSSASRAVLGDAAGGGVR